MNRNIRQWWLPSLILLLAILLASLLLPGLIYPGNIQRDNQQPGVIPLTSTPTLATTVEGVIITPATANVLQESQASPGVLVSTGQNCTYTIYYWRSNPNAWRAENILIGRFSYSKSEAIEILQSENQEVTTDLLKQFFAALLNSLKGVDTSSVDVSLVQSSDWLGRHALGLEVSQVDQQKGAALAKTLEEFNTGLTGPGLCADEPPTPTPGPTDTPMATETPTPTRIPTRQPVSSTSGPVPPTATEEKDEPPNEPSPPTEEPPTEQPPTEQPPTEPPPTVLPPTEPPPTQPPPTEPPLPTPTLAPEPTEAPTAGP